MSRRTTLRRSSGARFASVALALAIAGLWPAVAASQGGPPAPEATRVDVGEARRHFRQGVTLFNEGELEAALMEFRTSHRLNPLPQVLYNIALVERGMHRYADAAATLRRYLAEGTEEPAERRAEAEELAEEIEALVATVAIEAEPVGADLFVDGALAGRMPLEGPLRLSTGRHELELRLDGYQTHRQSVEVYGGQRLDLEISLGALGPIRRPWYRTWWFWTIVGVVAAGTLAGIVGGAVSGRDGADFEIEVISGGGP